MDRPIEEQLLDHLPWGGKDGLALPAHLVHALEVDQALAARWGSWSRQAQALTRKSAPEDLAGRVVAATHGGHRQVRAAMQLELLESLPAPEALDRAVRRDAERPFTGPQSQPSQSQPKGLRLGADSRGREGAPAELDRRVAEDLNDLPRAGARRAAARLVRKVAPEELDRRLEQDPLDRDRSHVWVPNRWVTVLTAASVLFVAGWMSLGDDPAGDSVGDTRAARATLPVVSFEIIALDPTNLDANHPLMSLSAFGGGVWEGSQR
jgi:hypothetical protein